MMPPIKRKLPASTGLTGLAGFDFPMLEVDHTQATAVINGVIQVIPLISRGYNPRQTHL